jgi:hypothetical protein
MAELLVAMQRNVGAMQHYAIAMQLREERPIEN